MALQNSSNNKIVAGVKVQLGSDAQGDIYYLNASGQLTRLGIGSPGQALVATATAPIWQTGIAPSGAAGGDLSGTYPNPTIANSAVTFPKMQNVATATILGRNTAGTGSIEALTATDARTVLGLGTAALANTGTASGNVPVLDAGGKLVSSVIPSVALTTIQVVANQAARLALANVEPGDVAKQTDNGISYVLSATPASTDANWIPIGDTTIVASDIVSGIINTARLGSGTADGTTFLRGDGTWAVPGGASTFTWNRVTGTSQALAVQSGYITLNAALTTLTLPATAAIGSTFKIAGQGAGGWRIAQNASQTIIYGDKITTSGTSGRIDSGPSDPFSTIEILCTNTNNEWQVLSATGVVDVI